MKWEADGGTLHLYDIVSTDALIAELARAQEHARDLGSAVLYAELFQGDPAINVLEAFGFTIDSTEPEVRDGTVTERLGLLKVL